MIVLLACLVTLPTLFKCRPRDTFDPRTALPAFSPSSNIISIEGDVDHAGIFFVGDKFVTSAVILLAISGGGSTDRGGMPSGKISIVNGMALHVAKKEGKCISISQKPMPAPQRLLLGIPLDINAMNVNDFDRLPGIGPVLADRIVLYRQNNGGKMKLTDLQNVEGIGLKKYAVLKKLF